MEVETIKNRFEELKVDGLFKTILDSILMFVHENDIPDASMIKVFAHPFLRRFIERDAYHYHFLSGLGEKELTHLMGVEVVDGYEVAIIIAAPELMRVNPVKIKIN